jgi:hypothetical protein
MPNYMNTESAAAYVDAPSSRLRGWRYDKAGPTYYKMGNQCRYRIEDLDAWIESRRIDPLRGPASVCGQSGDKS